MTPAILRNAFTAKNRLFAAGFLALALPAGLMLGASNAAFSGTTQNPGNTWDAANIELTNNHASALFAPTNITPGYHEEHCITITSTSTTDVDVKFYAESIIPSLLADNITLNVLEGSGGTNVDGVSGAPGSCTGFVPDAGAVASPVYDGTISGLSALSDYSTGGGVANLAAAGSKQYKITADLPSGAPGTLEGLSTGVTFVWEAQK